MNQQFFRLLRLCFICLDLLMINFSFAFDKFYYRDKIPSIYELEYVYLWVGFNVSWLVASWMCNIYHQNSMSSFESFCRRTLRAYVYFLTIILVCFFIIKQHDISRLFIITVFVTFCIVANAIEISQENKATEIFSTILPDQNETIYQIIQKAEQACIRFKLIPNFSLLTTFPVHIDYYGSIPILSLRKEPLEDVANRVRKRFFDVVVCSLVIIFILSWMIPLIGLLIWIDSRGPIFFIQTRSGKDNKSFGCIKFRSMKMNKESQTLQATKNDPRITKVGRFLRRSSLDEFPQFLNVFMGDMSIVGPRPHM